MTQKVLLAQTDTTVGFLSQNALKLKTVKQRFGDKSFVSVYKSFKALTASGMRIPQCHKQKVRASKKTTFIAKEKAFRVIKDSPHNLLLDRFDYLYSTSANRSGSSYDASFCFNNSDIIVEDHRGLYEGLPSHIIKLGKSSIRKLR
jgi:tRNA A37 threonylcarbamoyladenosine synthetase subunit TsaC/SUA5/YrdC